MQYMGSKAKLAKELLPIILKDRRPDQWYIECFAGGMNMISEVDGLRLANDNHYYLIEMWRALQSGWKPPEVVSKEEYYRVKTNQKTEHPALVGFVGFLCSFGGKWFGGYAANSKGDNYASRACRVLDKQIQKLQGVEFQNKNYWELDIPSNSILYLDPPYADTTNYSGSKFDHIKFWDWAKEKYNQGHTVFVSEYKAPCNWVCVKEIAHKTILDKNSQKFRVEKLFTIN